MTVADLGIAVTSNADKATIDLDRLVVASKAADAAARSLATSAVATARAELESARAITAAVRATEGATRAEIEAAAQKQKGAAASLAVAKADAARVAASQAAAAAALKLQSSSDAATASMRREAAAAQDLAVGLQRSAASGGYLTANLAQQAQDVVIAAQMGQSAIQVGLQQGMQAASVIQMLRSQGLSTTGALASAFGSLISPVNLVTIGLVSLGAVGIQTLMGMAPQAESATEAIARHAEALKDIVEGYEAAGDAVEDYIANAGRLPRGLAQEQITRQFAGIRREADEFRQQMERFGNDQMFAKYGSEATLSLQSLAQQFSSGELSAEEFYIAAGDVSSQLNVLERIGGVVAWGSTQSMITAFQEGALKALAFGSAIDQLVASSHALAGVGWNEGVATALDSSIEADRSAASHRLELDALNAKTPAQMRDIAIRRERIKLADEEITEALREQKVREAGELAFAQGQARAGKSATKDFDQWGNSKASFQLRIDQAQLEIELLGKSTFEVERQKAALDLLADAKRAGVPITTDLTSEINAMATDYANATVELERLAEAQKRHAAEMEFYKGVFSGFITGSLSGFRTAFANSEVEKETERLRIASDLLSQAQEDGIKVTAAQRAEIIELSQAMADAQFGANSMERAWKSAWDSIADAGVKALDRIADRAAAAVADQTFDWLLKTVLGSFGTIGVGGVGIPSGGFVPGLTGPKLFADGGYTGDVATTSAAGVVHGQEYVLNAAATRRIGRPALDALNTGRALANASAAPAQNDNRPNFSPVFHINGSNLSQEQMTAAISDALNTYRRFGFHQDWEAHADDRLATG